MRLIVSLNGLDYNPWHKWNLKQNPFPQIAKAEYDGFMMQLNSLDGDPITGPDDIRERLKGWSPEFIDLCIGNFQPGKRVKFAVTFPE